MLLIQGVTHETVRRGLIVRRRNLPKRYSEYYVHLTYKEAIGGEDAEKWEQAIQEEKESLK